MSTETETIVPPRFDDLLASKALAHIATVGPKGEPQTSPVWFDWDGTHLRFSQTTTRQKYRNLEREPRIAISIVDPANPYRYIEIRGTVERLDPDPDFAFINQMSKKYLGVDQYQGHQPGDVRMVVVVHPTHTVQMG